MGGLEPSILNRVAVHAKAFDVPEQIIRRRQRRLDQPLTMIGPQHLDQLLRRLPPNRVALPTTAPGCAPANRAAVNQCDRNTGFGQPKRSAAPRQSPANHKNIDRDRAIQPRTLRCCRGGCDPVRFFFDR